MDSPPMLQVSGVCESCARPWTCTILLDRTPHVRCICGHRHVVEFVGQFIPQRTAQPSVN